VEFYLLVIIMQWFVYLSGQRGALGDRSVWYERNWNLGLESLSLPGARLRRFAA